MGYYNSSSPQPSDEVYDLICIGFGPSSLAIAIAIQEMIPESRRPKVLFLERQQQFIWHSGMLLPGSKMQISFIKDLATLRDPRSEFTFLNYLKEKNRLLDFINLGTFLPLREEYNDYMQWCASKFDDVVSYGETVTLVEPIKANSADRVNQFLVHSKVGGIEERRLAKHVVVAVGGRPLLPKPLPSYHPRIVHSSQYSSRVPQALSDANGAYRIAVIGAGQSAAEVFSDVSAKYPNANTTLFIRGDALKPSDDSPFVNEIFNPSATDKFFRTPAEERQAQLVENRATNYSVVRLELIERIYHDLYVQRLRDPSGKSWKLNIQNHSEITGFNDISDKSVSLRMAHRDNGVDSVQTHEFDLVIVATGYARDMHKELLAPAKELLSDPEVERFPVGRDYRVQFGEGKVSADAGVYLQGCNETTHGLSDTLLSVLAVRAGEVVDSIFKPTSIGNGANGHSNGHAAKVPAKKVESYSNGNGHNGVTSNGYH
ncbi:hypothetical protein H072_9545 [Dactylellina haptotyla CBS 200.50]|uniref:L-ornithine N(5)-monooxygenase [NAD(P)H] n=1 Tax=Dactylellina haptotyla (strain CBS 200.50) TaxID=1284197 RepID=S8A2E0_DACHA|nr:hypothetical protein H072_9545 [Dactylellina haptotyla CBS 200.50]